MSPRNPIILFLCKFVVLYVLLVLPWPGWDRIYGAYFRTLGRAVFASEHGLRDLSFETMGPDFPHPLYTRVVISNRRVIAANELVPVRNLDLDAQAFGWKPTALLLALIVATPLAWRRRGRALLWGLPVAQIIILMFLGFCIWNESTEVGLVTLTPFWKNFAEGVKGLLVTQYDMVMPVVVWILVTFRPEDRRGVIGVSLFGPPPGAGAAPADAARK